MLSTLSKRQCFFPLFKQFLETEMTWSLTNIVQENVFSRISTYVSSTFFYHIMTSRLGVK